MIVISVRLLEYKQVFGNIKKYFIFICNLFKKDINETFECLSA